MNSKFKIGNKAKLSKAFAKKEVELCVKISTDNNPIHLGKKM
jgi:hypothetical protein